MLYMCVIVIVVAVFVCSSSSLSKDAGFECVGWAVVAGR